jgi:hypothetical protein
MRAQSGQDRRPAAPDIQCFNCVADWRRERTTSDGDGDHLLLIAFDELKASPAAKWESCRARTLGLWGRGDGGMVGEAATARLMQSRSRILRHLHAS